MTEKRLICVSCPVGCEITVRLEDGTIAGISGNRCPRGETYARQEAVDPMRVLPTNVKVVHGALPLVSVKTDRPVPRRAIEAIMRRVRALSVEAPVGAGQVLVDDLPGTDAQLVATRTVERTGESAPQPAPDGELARRKATRGRS